MLKFRIESWLVLGLVFLNVTVSQAAWKGVSKEATQILALTVDTKRGETLYEANCMECHEMEA